MWSLSGLGMNNSSWKIPSWLRQWILSQLVPLGPPFLSLCSCCAIHYVLGQRHLFTPLHYFFSGFFQIFRIIEHCCTLNKESAGVRKKSDHLDCRGQQPFRCQISLLPGVACGRVGQSPPSSHVLWFVSASSGLLTWKM